MIDSLLKFLDASPVNFLAVKNIAAELDKAGYRHLNPAEALGNVKAGDRFYVTKNDSSIYAFQIGARPLAEAGFRLLCAHCDSPTFRIKPNAEMTCEGGIVKLNTEVYGGPIMSTWFDRPLTLAGRVILRGNDALHPRTMLIHIQRPLLQISNLAIHFNRQVNDGVKLSRQKDVLPLLGIISNELERGNLLMNVIVEELNKQEHVDRSDILDFDLYLADTAPACTFGVHNEFISSGRLDDLSMCYAGLTALLHTPATDTTQVLAIFDNEETGSHQARCRKSVLGIDAEAHLFRAERLGGSILSSHRTSIYDFGRQRPWLASQLQREVRPNKSPTVGRRSSHQVQRSPEIRQRCRHSCREEAGVPCQRFVNHSDVAGGSTLGNILASSLPLRGVDMGNAVLAMHSCRETGSVADHEYCVKAFERFFEM